MGTYGRTIEVPDDDRRLVPVQRHPRGAPPNSSRATPASDVHPVLRRAAAPPAALDLLAQAQHGLDEAAAMETPNERYAIAHLAALRTAAAVLAVRGRPETSERRRRAIRSAWEVLPEAAPELSEWSLLFASGAPKRARAEAGIQGAASRRDADDLVRDAGVFLRLVERMLVSQPALPQPRVAPVDDEQEGAGPAKAPASRSPASTGRPQGRIRPQSGRPTHQRKRAG
ncbi:SAV_6107 family HEPN domain-containing protein [Streptomyces ovatisporus]|uniref:SAV_6107 family HEPN domain-containing protein n=1 Tax=Streptomyces ovatisporus TaxID=1128682 RepID=A0ABV9AC82_9ACTN